MTLASKCVHVALAGAILAPVYAAQEVTIDYGLEAGTTVGEPVILDVMIVNKSSGQLTVDLGLSSITGFSFDVVHPNGSRTRRSPLPRAGFQTRGRHSVEPNARRASFVVVNEWVRFDAPGRYEVAVTFNGAVTLAGGTPSIRRNAKWDVNLSPRNTARLRERCEEFLATIESDTYDTPGQRALAGLTWIRDPIAVPYLVKSALRRDISLEEVEALVRIGGPEARAGLEALTKSPNRFTALAAQGGLGRIK